MLVDTHAHLCDPCFDDDRDAVLDRAQAAGVGRVVAVGETLDDAHRNLELAQDPRIRPAAGLFPTHLDMDQAVAIEALLRRHRDRFVAVGEVGLDYWKVKDEDDRVIQREIFSRFIDLADELDLPVNVHSRSSGRHAIDLLIEKGARKVHLHAFDGKASHARRAVDAGFKLSIPPSVVRSNQKQKLIRALPLDAFMVETDSPVLGPDREARNEPANAVISVRQIAELQQIPEQQVRETVQQTTRELYGEL